MSRRAHMVVQFLLLVLWGAVLLADSVISVNSQTCDQPPYLWTNPLRNFWNANIGNVTVEIDQMFANQYPSVPDAAERIEAGHRGWNGQLYVLPMLTLLASVSDRLRKLRKRVGHRTEGFTG